VSNFAFRVLYPDEKRLAQWILGDRAREWLAKAAVLERQGLPRIDPFMGGRFWPASWTRRCVRGRHNSDPWWTDQVRAVCAGWGSRLRWRESASRSLPTARSSNSTRPDCTSLGVPTAPCSNTGRQARRRARGYRPRTVRLRFNLHSPNDRKALQVRCRTLTDTMLAWLSFPEALAQNTQRGYDDWCRTLDRAIGKRRVDRLTGQDLRLFSALLESATPGGAPRVRLARACVRSMLSILLSHGAELGLVGCLELAQVLERMTLRVPKNVRAASKAKRSRKVAMSYEQAAAIVAHGLASGTRRHRSIALGVAAQFEFTVRQIDVIGEWERLDRLKELARDAIVSHGCSGCGLEYICAPRWCDEAHESGAALVDIGKHAQHRDLNTTNRHYIVPSIETSRRGRA
jgi:hypothetical protein